MPSHHPPANARIASARQPLAVDLAAARPRPLVDAHDHRRHHVRRQHLARAAQRPHATKRHALARDTPRRPPASSTLTLVAASPRPRPSPPRLTYATSASLAPLSSSTTASTTPGCARAARARSRPARAAGRAASPGSRCARQTRARRRRTSARGRPCGTRRRRSARNAHAASGHGLATNRSAVSSGRRRYPRATCTPPSHSSPQTPNRLTPSLPYACTHLHSTTPSATN